MANKYKIYQECPSLNEYVVYQDDKPMFRMTPAVGTTVIFDEQLKEKEIPELIRLVKKWKARQK